MTVYHLRGSSCAGKSSAVKALLDKFPHESSEVAPGTPWALRKSKPTHIGYRLPGDLIILSRRYNDEKPTSAGMEGMRQQYIRDLTVEAGRHYSHVVLEGVTTSAISFKWLPAYKELKAAGHRVVTKMMDTPWEMVAERLATRSPGREVNLDEQYKRWKAMRVVVTNLQGYPDICEAGWVDYLHATEDIVRELQKDGWAP